MQTDFLDDNHLLQEQLEKDPSVVYMLDPNLRICYCNEAWDRFAAENNGPGLERKRQLGRSLMEAVPRPLQRFFLKGYGKVLETRQPWEHRYECSSASVFRAFRMVVYPNPAAEGLVVVNTLTVEHPRVPVPAFPDSLESVYSGEGGIVTMCCQCRRTARAAESWIWDWVPEFVERPPRSITHGICAVCTALIYPRMSDR